MSCTRVLNSRVVHVSSSPVVGSTVHRLPTTATACTPALPRRVPADEATGVASRLGVDRHVGSRDARRCRDAARDAGSSPTRSSSAAARRSSRRRSCTGSVAATAAACAGTRSIDAIVAVGRHFPGMSGGAAHGALVSRARARRRELDRDRLARRGQSRGACRRGRRPRVPRRRRRVAFGWLVGFSHLGAGAWLALAGAAALVAGSWFVAPSRIRRRPIGQNGRPGPVAQWSEQGTHNPSVEGSIPSRPTHKLPDQRPQRLCW